MRGTKSQASKLIGMIGGISPFSTTYYYELMNGLVRERLGARHSARCLVHAVDFAGVEAMHVAKDWPGVTRILCDAARSLEAGGAACVILACNTMHNVADSIEASVQVPFLHIGDAVGDAVAGAGHRTVGLLGTRFTMESAFLRERIEARGVAVAVPKATTRGAVHRIIYDELCAGVIRDASRTRFLEALAELQREHGVEAVVLGCTEIGLLLAPEQLPLPSFDTARCHAEAAVAFSLGATTAS